MRRIRVVPVALVVLLSAGALAGCTSAGSGGADAGGGRGEAVELQAGGAADQRAAAQAPADRAIVTTGSLRLVTERPIRAAESIGDLVEDVGGRVARSSEDPSGRASADLSLRIPADLFRPTLERIERQGDVRDLTVDATDVTARVTDYTVRITNLRTSIARLQDLLADADSSAALVEIEGALTDRQGRLEQLLAEQRTLEDQVAYATLDVAIVVPAAAPSAGPSDFLGGLLAGTDGLVRTLAAVAVAAGVLLPWIVVLGAIGGVALLIVRAVRRRTRPTSA